MNNIMLIISITYQCVYDKTRFLHCVSVVGEVCTYIFRLVLRTNSVSALFSPRLYNIYALRYVLIIRTRPIIIGFVKKKNKIRNLVHVRRRCYQISTNSLLCSTSLLEMNELRYIFFY